MPDADPNNYGGQRLDGLIGVSYQKGNESLIASEYVTTSDVDGTWGTILATETVGTSYAKGNKSLISGKYTT